jgi:hypothetical protein
VAKMIMLGKGLKLKFKVENLSLLKLTNNQNRGVEYDLFLSLILIKVVVKIFINKKKYQNLFFHRQKQFKSSIL